MLRCLFLYLGICDFCRLWEWRHIAPPTLATSPSFHSVFVDLLVDTCRSSPAFLPLKLVFRHSLRTVPRSDGQPFSEPCALNSAYLTVILRTQFWKTEIRFVFFLPWSLVLVHINFLRQGKFSDFLLVFEGLRTLSGLPPCITYRISCWKNFLLLLSINSGAWQMSSFRLNLTYFREP